MNFRLSACVASFVLSGLLAQPAAARCIACQSKAEARGER